MSEALKIIAKIETDFPTKFGIPRQSGLVQELWGRIIFEPEFRQEEAVRGLEEFSYIWILWEFSENKKENWSATVRPPRLGGKQRMGVFATRSPFRPNPIGISSVKLERIELDEKLGPVLYVSGADLMNQTPIYDIKPYLPYVDSHPEAKEGFAGSVKEQELQVNFPEELLQKLPVEKQQAAMAILGQDPRARYQKAAEQIYKVAFAGFDLHFQVEEGIVTVVKVLQL